MTVDSRKPVSILESDPSTDGQWITHLTDQITVQWNEHFSSNGQRSNVWARGVVPWSQQGINGIDDIYGDKYGMRSIDPVIGYSDGIIAYNLAYLVDQHGGRGLTRANGTVESFDGTVRLIFQVSSSAFCKMIA